MSAKCKKCGNEMFDFGYYLACYTCGENVLKDDPEGTIKPCPCCGNLVIKHSRAYTERMWKAMDLYYNLEDGHTWSLPRVGFASKESAETFKKEYPELDVFWTVKRKTGQSTIYQVKQ